MALFSLARRDESRRQLSTLGLISFDIAFRVQRFSALPPPIAFTLKYDAKWWQVVREMAIGYESCGLYLGADVIESPDSERISFRESHQHHALRFLAKPFSTTSPRLRGTTNMHTAIGPKLAILMRSDKNFHRPPFGEARRSYIRLSRATAIPCTFRPPVRRHVLTVHRERESVVREAGRQRRGCLGRQHQFPS